jgi:tetratricopeptide (TPR) repeat protein
MLPTIAGLAPEAVERLSGTQLVSVWHAMTAGRRLLTVWDNVKHPDQVRPLLVMNDGCASIIISRDTIVINHWESPIWLDVLDEQDAIGLARQILGGQPPDADVLRLVRGNLYVPVLIASHARAVRGGTMSLREVLAELPETHGDIDGSQRDLFERLDGSYFNLDPEQRLAFRMIGSHPGTFATLDASSAVLDLEIRRTRELMDGLVQAGLLARFHHGDDFEDLEFRSYNCHDLLRSYAAHRARQEGDDAAILDALVDHYQARLDRYSADDQRWFSVEADNVRDTALAGESERHVRLAGALGWLAYELRQHGLAVTAFQHAQEILSDDPQSHELALTRLGLGNIALARGDYELAWEYCDLAAAGFQSSGDQYSHATALRGLAYAMQGFGFPGEAIGLLEHARDSFTQIGRLDLAAAVLGDIRVVDPGYEAPGEAPAS